MAVSFDGVLRQLVEQTVSSGKPTALIKGEVVSISPLTIRIEGRLDIQSDFLELTHNVRDYAVDISVNHVTENRAGGVGDPAFESHNHDYTGRKRIIIHNGLRVGEFVWLVRQGGGQMFVVLDRVNDPACSGQWG